MDGGIPSISVFIGLLALPQLWDMYQTRNSFDVSTWKDITIGYRLRTLFTMPYKMSALRGSVIGVVTGLIPGIGYVISSSVANSVEEKLCHRAEDSENETHFKCVVSSESANNSGSMIVLIPLLVLALPVIPSEAVIFSLAEKAGFGYGTSYSFLLSNGSLMIGILMAVNIFNWVLSGVFYNAVSKIFNSIKTYIYQSLIVFVLIMVALAASQNNQIMLTMSFLAVFTAIGLYIKDFGLKIIILFAFLLADTIVNEYYRFYLLNF
jgi:putative tricarboxylic transport membrane protein